MTSYSSSSISSSSSSTSSSSILFDYAHDITVAMACRNYGQGRILIHTDRIGAFKTGHKDNSNEFWRRILEWTSNSDTNDTIRVGLVINTQPSDAEKMNSFKPISVKKIKISDIFNTDLSKFDCLYFVGLPNSISSVVTSKIRSFVENGGGLVIEYPNISSSYINILIDIEKVYCYNSDRLIKTSAYWTIDGGNNYVHDNNAVISFMSTLRQSDFSSEWTILMTNIENQVPDSNIDDPTDGLIYDKKSSASFTVSYLSMMQNGIASMEWGTDFTSSSSSESTSSSTSSSSITSSSSSSSTFMMTTSSSSLEDCVRISGFNDFGFTGFNGVYILVTPGMFIGDIQYNKVGSGNYIAHDAMTDLWYGIDFDDSKGFVGPTGVDPRGQWQYDSGPQIGSADYCNESSSSSSSTSGAYCAAYESVIPQLDSSHVLPYSYFDPYYGYLACDPSQSLSGVGGWWSGYGDNEWIKFNIDLGHPEIIKKIYIDNFHWNGAYQGIGIKNFLFYGTNSYAAFLNVGDYFDLTDLTFLYSGQARMHNAFDGSDPEYFYISNRTAFRYYVFRIVDNWVPLEVYVGARRIELQKCSEISSSST